MNGARSRREVPIPIVVARSGLEGDPGVIVIDGRLRSFRRSEADLCCTVKGVFDETKYWVLDGDLWVSTVQAESATIVEDPFADEGALRRTLELVSWGIVQAPFVELTSGLMGDVRERTVDGRGNDVLEAKARAAAPEIDQRLCVVDGEIWARSDGPVIRPNRKQASPADACLKRDSGSSAHQWFGQWAAFAALDDADVLAPLEALLGDFWGDRAEQVVRLPWRDRRHQHLALTAERMLWSFLRLVRDRPLVDIRAVLLVAEIKEALERRWPGMRIDASTLGDVGLAPHLYGRTVPLPHDLHGLLHRVVEEAKALGLGSHIHGWRLALDWIDAKMARIEAFEELEGFAL